MTQNEIATEIGKYLYNARHADVYQVSELLGLSSRWDASSIQKLDAKTKFSTTTELRDALKQVYSAFNPADYNQETVVIWVYVDAVVLGEMYIGFSRTMTANEWENIRRMLRSDYVDMKDNFGILTY